MLEGFPILVLVNSFVTDPVSMEYLFVHNRAACLWILSSVLRYFDCADPMQPRHILILIDGVNRKSIVFFLVDSVVMKSETMIQCGRKMLPVLQCI